MSTYPAPALITGFGGINTAGRSSGHMAFQRVVYQALDRQQKQETLNELKTKFDKMLANFKEKKEDLIDLNVSKTSMMSMMQNT